MVDTSSSRPQLMFAVSRVKPNLPYGIEASLFSVYQDENPLMLSSGHPKMLLSPTVLISQPIRGLFCLQENKRVKIYNPVTNKYSATSPEIPAPEDTAISTFFGYDEKTDVYKVLGIIEVVQVKGRSRKTLEQTFYVWTMGSDENAWKQITCDQPLHSPYKAGPGLSKGGVLYYRAKTNSEKSLLMSFNVGSGTFSAIQVPENFNISRRGMQLVIYEDNIALVDDWQFTLGPVIDPNGNLAFDIWVRNDENGGSWLNKRVEIPGWKETVLENTTDSIFLFRGTTKTGILVFSTGNSFRKIGDEESLFVVCYDEHTKDLIRFTVEQGDEATSVQTYLDYTDSPLLL